MYKVYKVIQRSEAETLMIELLAVTYQPEQTN